MGCSGIYAVHRPMATLSDGCLKVSKLSSLASEHATHQLAQLDDYVSYMSSMQESKGH